MYKFDTIHPVLVNDREQINAGSNTITNVVDTAGFSGGLLVLTVHWDVMASAANITTFEVQESDDDSTYSTVSGCDAVNGVQADGTASPGFDGNDDQTMVVFYIPLAGARKRYYKIVATNSGSANAGFACTGLIFGQGLATSPASSSATDGPSGSVYRASNV